jgi:cytochrome P450
MERYEQADFFMDLSLVDDPYPYFEHLRAKGPVTPLPAHNVVAVMGFDEALQVHLDTEHLSAVNSVTGPLPPLPFEPEEDDITEQIAAHRAQMPFGEDVLTQDPPRHTPLRSLMMRLFTPRRLREMEPTIAAIAANLIEEVEPRGRCEFVHDFARPFALLGIAELLGLPDDERDEFRANDAAATSQVGASATRPVVNPLDFRRDKFVAYIEDRRSSPRGDILSDLATATYPDGVVPPVGDVVRVASLLFGAGQDTTATLLGNAIRILACDAALQQQLRDDPRLIPPYIEEVLRYEGPVKSTFRLARKPLTLGGVDIAPGTTVMIATAAANRDPAKYADPATFQIGRGGGKEHLSFGRGIHTCPGAALARAQARISLELLLRRFARIEIDPAAHGPSGARRFGYQPTYVFRTLTALHLILAEAAA